MCQVSPSPNICIHKRQNERISEGVYAASPHAPYPKDKKEISAVQEQRAGQAILGNGHTASSRKTRDWH